MKISLKRINITNILIASILFFLFMIFSSQVVVVGSSYSIDNSNSIENFKNYSKLNLLTGQESDKALNNLVELEREKFSTHYILL